MMTDMQIDERQQSAAGRMEQGLKSFMALPVESRLDWILQHAFATWRAHANDGVSLVYDQAILMIAQVTKDILMAGASGEPVDCKIFSTRMVLNIETGYDAFDPDAGAFTPASAKSRGELFMIETAVRAMSSSDAPFDARYLIPQDPAQQEKLKAQFGRVFSTQFRFWSEDHADFAPRLAAFHAQMAAFPQIKVAEKQFSASLRQTNRFRLKRKVLDFYETPVRAIAIGQDWPD